MLLILKASLNLSSHQVKLITVRLVQCFWLYVLLLAWNVHILFQLKFDQNIAWKVNWKVNQKQIVVTCIFDLFVASIVSSDSIDDDAMSSPSGAVANGTNGANGVAVEHQDDVTGSSGTVANEANDVTVQAEVHNASLMLPQMVDGEYIVQDFQVKMFKWNW